MQGPKYLIVVGGPTASGKTDLALQLARHFGTEILSCDSRQFYREMRIGNARPGPEALRRVRHHFIADRSVEEPLSAGAYAREALDVLRQLYRTRDHAILVGGSGLYQKALCEGLDDFPEVPSAIRDDLQRQYEEQGLAALQEELARSDPAYFATVDRQNPARLLRALGVIRSSGQAFSHFRAGRDLPRPFRPLYLWLHRPRTELYDRINTRVDHMMAAGLLDEVRSLLPFRHLDALQTVGYRELFEHLDGSCSRPEAVDRIKRNTRRYAKRQVTWRRRDGHWMLVQGDHFPEARRYAEWGIQDDLRLRAEGSPVGRLQLSQRGRVAAHLRLGREKQYGWMAGPWLDQPDLPAERIGFLLDQGLRRLPEGTIRAASPAFAKPFYTDLGFVPDAAGPPHLLSRLAAAGEAETAWQYYIKTDHGTASPRP